MIKHEIKVEFTDSESLKNIIEQAYFRDGFLGKITSKIYFLRIDESDEVNYAIFKGLNSATVKLLNDEIVDGSMRFMVDETRGDVRLYPISIYCIKEDDKYIFY